MNSDDKNETAAAPEEAQHDQVAGTPAPEQPAADAPHTAEPQQAAPQPEPAEYDESA